jgi:prepilin-type N-terminal cleavage/methylation domain-containing protein
MNKNKGFTLIELLVVIAIIGILSSVVLASLSSARNKGKDAAVKSQLASMRAQAELYYATNTDSYLGVCTAASASNGFGGAAGVGLSGPGLIKATQDAAGIGTTVKVALTDEGAFDFITCHDSIDAWAVDAPMTASTEAVHAMYCVDSTGVSKAMATSLPASQLECDPIAEP